MRNRFIKRLDISVFDGCDPKMHKFINVIMRKGNKQLAYRQFLNILKRVKFELKQSPKQRFSLLLKQMGFPIKVSEVVVSKIKFKIPHYLKASRAITTQYINIVRCSDSRSENSFFERVSCEFLDYCKGIGNSYKLFTTLKNQIRESKAHGRFKV